MARLAGLSSTRFPVLDHQYSLCNFRSKLTSLWYGCERSRWALHRAWIAVDLPVLAITPMSFVFWGEHTTWKVVVLVCTVNIGRVPVRHGVDVCVRLDEYDKGGAERGMDMADVSLTGGWGDWNR